LDVTLTAVGPDKPTLEALVDAARADLQEGFASLGFTSRTRANSTE
jgi:hypothetical protein